MHFRRFLKKLAPGTTLCPALLNQYGNLMKLPTLNELLEYQNPAVLKLYIQNYPNNKLDAETAFRETLKYLWLAQKHQFDLRDQPENASIPKRCVMLFSMQEIDQMWHEFILFTSDYTKFCEKYFGVYMHHLPNIFDNMPVSIDDEREDITVLLPYIYDQLGEETMRIWFAEYLSDAA